MRPWSYSRLGTWEECPKQYWYGYIERIKGSRPENPAASRGTILHDQAEAYLKDELKIYPPEFQKVAGHTMMLKTKKAIPERKLAVTDKWEPCGYDAPEAYFRARIDVILPEGTIIGVEDWKTGQAYEDHPDQINTYVAVAAAHYPEATEFRGRLIYIDQGYVTPPKITAMASVKPIRMMLDGRIKNAEDDTIWPTRSGRHCKYCDYSSRHGGPCPF